VLKKTSPFIFRQKFLDTVSSTFNTVYNIATGQQVAGYEDEQLITDTIARQANEADLMDETNPRTLESPLNGGNRKAIKTCLSH
jgi:ABC-type phosphate transport system ATPase subunit